MREQRRRPNPELLQEFSDHIAAVLKEEGLADESAGKITVSVLARIAAVFGGTMLYVPMGRAAKAFERQQAIVRDFNGANVKELAVKYGIAEPSVYRIMNRAREERLASRR